MTCNGFSHGELDLGGDEGRGLSLLQLKVRADGDNGGAVRFLRHRAYRGLGEVGAGDVASFHGDGAGPSGAAGSCGLLLRYSTEHTRSTQLGELITMVNIELISDTVNE